MYRHSSTCLNGPVSRVCVLGQEDSGEELLRANSRSCQEMLRSSRGESLPIRGELVARVRREIAAGSYDTPEKWEVALDRLLDRLDLA